MQALSNVESVACVVSNIDATSGGAQYDITFNSYPKQAYENDFFSHTGAPSLSDIGCSLDDISSGNSPTCTITEQVTGTAEYTYCSNRGLCDFKTGACSCFSNYYGTACENEGAIATVGDDESALELISSSSTYTGSILTLQASKSSQSDYNFLRSVSNGAEVYKLTGQGIATAAGLTATLYGLSVSEGGAFIVKTTNADVVTISGSYAGFASNLLTLAASDSASSTFNSISATANGVATFTLDGVGNLVTAATTAATSSSTGSIITAGGIGAAGAVHAGGNVETSASLVGTALEITSASALSTTTGAGMITSSVNSGFTGNVLQLESAMPNNDVGAANFNFLLARTGGTTNKFAVDGTGQITTEGGIVVNSGGILVSSGGATISSGGLDLTTSGMTLSSSSAVSIAHTGGSGAPLTISSGGGLSLSSGFKTAATVETGATLSVDLTHSGTTIFLDRAAGMAITLLTCSSTTDGANFQFYVLSDNAGLGAGYVITHGGGVFGSVQGFSAAAEVDMLVATNGGASTTFTLDAQDLGVCGAEGSAVTATCIGSLSKYLITANVICSGTPALANSFS